MAGFNGRELTVDWDSVTLVGVRSKGISRSNELVDVTTDDDNGWRTLLANPGIKSIDVNVDGITSDETLIAEFYAARDAGVPLTINLPTTLANAGTETGTFLLSSFETNGSHDGSVEFSASFMSSGAVAFTASSGV